MLTAEWLNAPQQQSLAGPHVAATDCSTVNSAWLMNPESAGANCLSPLTVFNPHNIERR